MFEKEMTRILNGDSKLRFEDLKISYLILKPNAEKHYKEIIETLEKNQFIILNQYAIFDYETVNMALHIKQPKAMKYLIPISRLYKDLYGNYGILVVIGKKNITYENFCLQVVSIKKYLRSKYEYQYVSYTFDTSKIDNINEQQKLMIMDRNGIEVKKDKFNETGTFMVFSINEVHSPDENLENTYNELCILNNMELFNEDNILPKTIINYMKRYKTFEFLKDML